MAPGFVSHIENYWDEPRFARWLNKLGSFCRVTLFGFTDIVNSTAKAAAIGDQAWRDLLNTHDKTVRSELARFRGNEIKSLGDGFLATFDAPARAIRCKGAIRDALKRVDMPVRG
jgi:class 3 adenylate cyclase